MKFNHIEPTIATVCFTGPRPTKLYGYIDDKSYMALLRTVQTHLIDLIKNNHTKTFITGGAQGFDQLVFWAVADLKANGYNIQNVVYIPFAHQSSRWMKTDMFGQLMYQSMLSAADKVIDVHKTLHPNISNEIQLFAKRNEAMVNNADLVIGCYDFEANDYQISKGGTAAALRYATSRRPIALIHPQTHTTKIIELKCMGLE